MTKKNDIYLIGGAPTVGKSTIAKKLSEELTIPWISSDFIRSFMRLTAPPKRYPHLWLHKNYDAQKYLQTFTAQQIVKNQNQESLDT